MKNVVITNAVEPSITMSQVQTQGHLITGVSEQHGGERETCLGIQELWTGIPASSSWWAQQKERGCDRRGRWSQWKVEPVSSTALGEGLKTRMNSALQQSNAHRPGKTDPQLILLHWLLIFIIKIFPSFRNRKNEALNHHQVDQILTIFHACSPTF